MKAKLYFFLAVIFAFTLPACVSNNSKQDLGTLIGGATGALIGNQASDKNKKTWTLVGGALGAYVGNRIGKYLDEQDKQRMAQATQQAAKSGQMQTWSNPENKTSGRATIVATKTKTEPVKVPVLKAKIKKVPPLDMMGETYRARKKSNLRGGPGTDYVKVGHLNSGENVNVVGKVKEKKWYLVSHDGVGSGFVYSSLVVPALNETPAPSETTIAKSDVVEQQISSSRVCRTVKQSVTLADGSTHEETIEACQGPNGWEAKV